MVGVLSIAPLAHGPGHSSAWGQAATGAARLPLFRHVDASLVKARPPKPAQLRFLLSDDFPPFVYRNRNGALTGYAVAVAQAICRRGRMRCRFIVQPREKLLDQLLSGRGDVVLGGVRLTADMWARLDFTRPYFMSLGRFAVSRKARITTASREALVGRRVAVVKGSLQALWLARNMNGVRILLLPDFARAAAELREGRADALFADWLQMAFWVRGEDAAGCCRLLPGLMASPLFSYNHLSMALRPGARNLRDFLDWQLDLLQEDGQLRILARQFLPLSEPAAGDTTAAQSSTGPGSTSATAASPANREAATSGTQPANPEEASDNARN